MFPLSILTNPSTSLPSSSCPSLPTPLFFLFSLATSSLDLTFFLFSPSLHLSFPSSLFLQSRTETADGLLQSLGPRSALVPSSNHPDIMAGQGTIAMEMMEQVCVVCVRVRNHSSEIVVRYQYPHSCINMYTHTQTHALTHTHTHTHTRTHTHTHTHTKHKCTHNAHPHIHPRFLT